MASRELILGGALLIAMSNATADTNSDPYQWLEDVKGDKALAWVREQNAVSSKELEAQPTFESTRTRLLAMYDSDERIPGFAKLGPYLYNFWRDKKNVRGVWRRTSLEEYRKSSPAWETVLDVDALAAKENENWVWSGFSCSFPDYKRCLIRLSRGGGDTFVTREFDVASKEFVQNGFQIPAAKTRVSWRTSDSLFVGTDFGPGSLTDSGYPRIIKVWQRGTPLSAATTIFEGQKTDVSVAAFVDESHEHHRELLSRAVTFYSSEQFLYENGKTIKLDVPDDADIGSFKHDMLLELRSDWSVGGKTYPSGALLAIGWQEFMAGKREFTTLFEPTARSSLSSYSNTKDYLLVNVLDNIRSRAFVWSKQGGKWTKTVLPTPEIGTTTANAYDEYESDEYLLSTTDFLTPSALYLGKIGSPERALLKKLPAFFDASGLQVTQHEAISKDGTRVPYFQIARRDLNSDGKNATLLYGYGGFQVSYTPTYSGGMGLAWLEKGGVYVLANIRGGGEFGPKWHQAALKQNRQRAYDDFAAVAEDLIKRKVTSPEHLGIMGGSNGGLLVGVLLTERPELFGAVVCQVPLLDMHRYHKLLAGASWMAEYGDPDKPDEWSYISKYSPYQNVSKDKKYPRVLFTTSTRDDRVHPGHARKMMARMKEQGHDVLLYENIEGGHGGAANNKQSAYMNAISYAFLWKQLK